MSAAWGRWSCAAIAVAWSAAAVHYANRGLPAGMHLSSAAQSVPTRDVSFLYDITGADAYDHGFSSHSIFDAMLRNIGAARDLVVLDCHLCSDAARESPDPFTAAVPMASQLVSALLARKAAIPTLQVLVIADPINGVAGSSPAPELARLTAAGIPVVTADLSALRDRNVLYGAPSRLIDKLTGHARAQLTNFKSSDRRVLIADDGHGTLTALVGTAEPALADSTDTVTALAVTGPAVWPLLTSELQLARAFGWPGNIAIPVPDATASGTGESSALDLRWLGEGAIRDALLAHIGAARATDSIDIACDSLSDRRLINALLAASRRGVAVRIIMDPRKNSSLWGSANQTVGSELIAASDGHIRVAWYRTHNEQFRAALVLIHGNGSAWMVTGSASLTRRDLGDYDLALDAMVSAPPAASPVAGAQTFFDTLWDDRGPPGIEYTADADAWADPSQLRYWAYRFMELLGISRT